MAVNASKKRDRRSWKKWKSSGAVSGSEKPIVMNFQTAMPADYKCSRCGADNCKLWRRYQTFKVELLCAVCAGKDQKEDISGIDSNGCRQDPVYGLRTEIGWFVLAVPTGQGSYWGCMAVSDDAYQGWLNLPTLPQNQAVK